MDDGDIAYTIITTMTSGGDAVYNAIDPANVGVTNFAGAYLRPVGTKIFTFEFNAPGNVVADYIKFRRENLIFTRRGKVVLVDLDALLEIAELG